MCSKGVFKPLIGSHSLHNITSDNGLIDLAAGKGLVIKSTMSLIGTFIRELGGYPMEDIQIRLIMF